MSQTDIRNPLHYLPAYKPALLPLRGILRGAFTPAKTDKSKNPLLKKRGTYLIRLNIINYCILLYIIHNKYLIY